MNKNQTVSKIFSTAIVGFTCLFLTACNDAGSNSSLNSNATSSRAVLNTENKPQLVNSIANFHFFGVDDGATKLGAQNLNNNDVVTTVSESDIGPQPIKEYAYAAAGKSIEIFRFESSGGLTPAGSVAVPSGLSSNAQISALAISPNHTNVYATIKNGSNDDKIWMLNLNPLTGQLKSLATPLVSTNKSGISSVAISKSSMFVYVTESTQICTYKLKDDLYDGTLQNSYMSCISPAVNNKVSPYGQITLSANGKYAFVTSGTSLDTIITLKRESNGTLSYLSQKSTGVSYNLSMAIPESGGFIYTALKNNHAAGQYSINGATGQVSPLYPQSETTGTDSEPHAVVLTPNRKYAYVTNYHNKNISIFKINANGTLQQPDTKVLLSENPDKIVMDKMGKFIYVSTLQKHILQYKIDYNSGMLTPTVNQSIAVSESISQMAVTDIEGLNISWLPPQPYQVTDPDMLSVNIELSAGTNKSLDAIKSDKNIQVYSCESDVTEVSEVQTSDFGGDCILLDGILLDALSTTVFEIGVIRSAIVGAFLVYVFKNLPDLNGNVYADDVVAVPVKPIMVNPQDHAVDVKPDVEIIIESAGPINKSDFHLVDLMSQIEIMGETTTGKGDDHYWLKFKPNEQLNYNTDCQVYMGFFSWLFRTRPQRVMKIYTLTNNGAGYYPSRMNVASYDGLCTGGPEMPKETDGGPTPVYKALLGTDTRKPGSADWPLHSDTNTDYYNTSGQHIGWVDENDQLSGYKWSDEQSQRLKRPNLNNLILPVTPLRVWTGIKIDTMDGSLTPSNWKWVMDSSKNCSNWMDSSSGVKGRYGVNSFLSVSAVFDAENYQYIDYGELSCDIPSAIYCVQQS